jgi:predicted dehydrogenase
MERIRTAVIGVGYLGRFHAQKYAALEQATLVGVADSSAENRERIGKELGVPAHADYRELLGRVDAVSIATPTPLHYAIGAAFLESGTHVLVEKPITTTVADARRLIELATRKERVLQVGHLERFNAGLLALDGILTTPRFIESHRLAPFKQRGTDVNVVLDLMIHDIDIIQDIVHAPIATLDAVGAPVFSGEIDIANARIRFANGCVANTTASRVSLKTERKLRLFQDDAYMSVDLQQKILTVVRKTDRPMIGDLPPVNIEERTFEQGDALKAEIESFLDCIARNKPPIVSGEDGLRALETAIRITEQVTGTAYLPA